MKYLVLLIVLTAIYGIISYFGKRKRESQDSTTDPSALKPGTVNRTVSLNGAAGSIEKIKATLQAAGCRIINGDNNTVIAYGGNGEQAKLHGVVNADPHTLPVRIVFTRIDNNLSMRMDEDYGFQMFMGPAKTAFNNNYEKTFDYYEGLVKNA